jgi:hypothetical protein
MLIIGVPDDVDPCTVHPKGDWELSARCKRELAENEARIAEARGELSALSDLGATCTG